ncbi:hypothetical protein Syun_031696 [Stephania yunnanensis]|uniref:Uncharacterized protein n=1 Tax=Stephania yunnanensis TaxID=152371 RepID=A0AAP0E4E4_9MAGN
MSRKMRENHDLKVPQGSACWLNYASPEMFESDLGGGKEDFGMESAREIDTSNLPVFLLESRRSKGLSGGGHCWGFNVGVVFVVMLGFVVWGCVMEM